MLIPIKLEDWERPPQYMLNPEVDLNLACRAWAKMILSSVSCCHLSITFLVVALTGMSSPDHARTWMHGVSFKGIRDHDPHPLE
jgi:hypothetical protein